MDLSGTSTSTSSTTTARSTTPTSPRPQGHIWSTRLASWVVPITRKPGRWPSPQHVHCSEPPCWVLVEALEPLDPDAPAS